MIDGERRKEDEKEGGKMKEGRYRREEGRKMKEGRYRSKEGTKEDEGRKMRGTEGR